MQLKPLAHGRFHSYWQDNYFLIKKIFKNCCIEHKHLNKNHVLFHQSSIVHHLILVHNGKISIRYTAENGRRFHLGTMTCDEQLFGEMEFFTNYPCQFDIIAEESLSVSLINANKLHQDLLNNPKLALFFASAIAVDYQDTLEILFKRMLYPISYNIAYDLYQQHLNLQPVDHFDKYYLEAERFATTDRVYRRAVKELMELGIVTKQEGELKIKNVELLKRYINEGDTIE